MISVNNEEHMFEQKYRPQTIEECILPDLDKKIFSSLIQPGKKLPHLILQSNSPGTGKTTIAYILAKMTNSEYLFVNGADCRIDFIRNTLEPFATAGSMDGKHKVIIIDEFDRAGLGDAQRHLRSFMEAHSKNCSIIITANNLEGIITPLQSRARVIKFGSPNDEDKLSMMKQMILRCEEICRLEDIEVKDRKVIAHLVKQNFPDFRKIVNELDLYSARDKVIDAGILSAVTESRGSISDVVDALKTKNVKELRKLAIKYAPDYPHFIKQLSDELYPLLKGPSILAMYEILGDNNKFYGLAANMELHLMHAFASLVVEMVWNG